MKKVILIISVFSCLTVMGSGWKLVSEDAIIAKTPEEIWLALATESSAFAWLRHDHVNREIARLNIDAVVKIDYKVRKLRWDGETTCAADDPRLEVKLLGGSVERASGGTEAFEDIIADNDPCR